MNLQYIIWLGFLLLFSACSSTKFLQDDERLLVENKVNIIAEQKITNKAYLKYELSTKAQQQPNSRFFFIPREWLYYKSIDTSRTINRMVSKRLAEPPVIFEEEKMDYSAKRMALFMKERGYYNAEVVTSTKILPDNKRLSVIYDIYPKQQYFIDTITYFSRDTAIQKLLSANSNNRFLKQGVPGSIELYNKEVKRIVSYLRNEGYAEFNARYIRDLIADSSDSLNMRLMLEVMPPAKGRQHQKFTVGNITVFPNYEPLDSIAFVTDSIHPIHEPKSPITYVRDTLIEDIHFMLTNERNYIYPSTLLREITLRSGQVYDLSKQNQMYEGLSSLGVFRDVLIRPQIDSVVDTIINYNIFLTRSEPISVGPDIDASYSNQYNTSNNRLNLVGLETRLSLDVRNAFRRAELLSSNLSLELEFDIFNNFKLNTVDIGVQEGLDIPRFIDYLKLWSLFKPKAREAKLYDFLYQNATTRIGLNYNFLRQQNFYAYQLLNGTFGFDTQFAGKNRLIVNHIGIDYFNPRDIDENFQEVLDANPFLERSFGDQLFTGFLFRQINYFYKNVPNRYGRSFVVNLNLELSGLEVELANVIYNQFALEPQVFKIGDTDFSRFVRGEIEFSFNNVFDPAHSLAFRTNIGIGSPFGGSTDVPYVEQFFIGGPNSIRAFAAREIGPGAYCSADVHGASCGEDTDVENNNIPFYQTGTVKLEANLEYRFDVASFFGNTIEGALFLDAGNVWLAKQDTSRANAQFLFSALKDEDGNVINEPFYRQLAIGTGLGFRFDLNYFILRLDVGYPLRTPYRGSDAWQSAKNFSLSSETLNYNLAIGYPF